MTVALSRRALLAGVGGALLASACSRAGGERGVVRIGVMANLTHAPMLAGLASGRLARAIAPSRLESRVFRAGPRVTEALLGGAIDLGSSGPAAIVSTHARHPDALRILAGIASGGASFVVAANAGISRADDLRGKSLATPQIGSTQDVSLRKYLHDHGLTVVDRGGDVRVLALASSDIRVQMMRGQLAGAWLPEPWATRLVTEGIATRLFDERTLWDGGRFATALLAGRRDFERTRPTETAQIVDALRLEVERAIADPAACEEEAFGEVKRLVSNPGPRPIFHEAWKLIDFTNDPMKVEVAAFARDAYALGLVPQVSCDALFGAARA